MRGMTWFALVGVLGSGCVWQGTPVPVTGDLEGLAGEWEGTYSSDESGRSGTISFKLDAATDSAFGDVWMTPTQVQEIPSRDAPRTAAGPVVPGESLRIAFIRAERGRVTGRLEGYDDPVTHARLSTVFEGRQRGDRFRGSYTTRSEESGRVIRGEWQARRNVPRP